MLGVKHELSRSHVDVRHLAQCWVLGASLASSGCQHSRAAIEPPSGRDAAAPPSSEHAVDTGCAGLDLGPGPYDARFDIAQELAPGEETEICEIQETGDQDIWMNSSQLLLSPGSHHGLLWQTSYLTLPDSDLQGDPIVLGKVVPCRGGANGRYAVTRPLAGSQGRDNITGAGVYPADVALRVPPHSYVVLDLHMLNATQSATSACMKVGLTGVAAQQVKYQAGVLFMYNTFITVPAGQASRARLACPVPKDVMLATAASHMHKLGVGYSAKWLDGDPFEPATSVRETLYATTNWDDPSDTIWSEPRALRAGDFIDYTCEYQNPSDMDVAQGLGTTDEMCMFTGAYWPDDRAFDFCARAGSGSDASGSAGYSIGTGQLDGQGFIDCVLNADYAGGASEQCSTALCKNYAARYAWQSCFTQACPAIGRYTRSYLDCLGDNNDACTQQCPAGSGICVLDCFASDKCKRETDALLATACD
jgi:hypothetical protein